MPGERVTSRWFNPDAVTSKGRGSVELELLAEPRLAVQPRLRLGRDVRNRQDPLRGRRRLPAVGQPGSQDRAPTETAEIIDINTNVGSPHWTSTDPMHFPRRHLNATVLPNGQVLVTGGTSAGGFNTLSGAVHAAEAWDPTSGHWTVAREQHHRPGLPLGVAAYARWDGAAWRERRRRRSGQSGPVSRARPTARSSGRRTCSRGRGPRSRACRRARWATARSSRSPPRTGCRSPRCGGSGWGR